MPITINTNVSAMISQRNLGASSTRSASSLAKLSSGSRVPTAKEDAASLALGSGLRTDVTALKAAQVNAQQATSLLQIADGAFGQISDILNRMKSLTTTAQSQQLSSTELGFLNQEFSLLRDEINRISTSTEFNSVKLLGGKSDVVLDAVGTDIGSDAGFVAFSFNEARVSAGDEFEVSYDSASGIMSIGLSDGTNIIKVQSLEITAPAVGSTTTYDFASMGVKITLNGDFDAGTDINPGLAGGAGAVFSAQAGSSAVQANLDFQVGIVAGDTINVQIALGSYQELVGGAGVTVAGVATQADAIIASNQVDAAVDAVSAARADLGSYMNRLEFAQSNLAVSIENTEAARSVLMDVDVSVEITKFTSEQVLIQAGVSMLAQANQQPSLLLRLLQ